MKALAQEQIEELERKLAEILAMKATIEHLVHCCKGDDRPECPILDTLAGDERLAAEQRETSRRRDFPLVPAQAAAGASAMTDGRSPEGRQGRGKDHAQARRDQAPRMPAVTMVFLVKDKTKLDRFKAGDKVRFSADKLGGAFTITQIEMAK